MQCVSTAKDMSSDPCRLNDAKNEFVCLLGVTEEVASILAISGYYSIEDISRVSVEELKAICGIDTELVASLLANARKHVAENFSLKTLGPQFANILREVAGRG